MKSKKPPGHPPNFPISAYEADAFYRVMGIIGYPSLAAAIFLSYASTFYLLNDVDAQAAFMSRFEAVLAWLWGSGPEARLADLRALDGISPVAYAVTTFWAFVIGILTGLSLAVCYAYLVLMQGYGVRVDRRAFRGFILTLTSFVSGTFVLYFMPTDLAGNISPGMDRIMRWEIFPAIGGLSSLMIMGLVHLVLSTVAKLIWQLRGKVIG